MKLDSATHEHGPDPIADNRAESRQLRFLELLAASAGDLLQADDLVAALERLFRMIRTELRIDAFSHYSFDDEYAGSLGLLAHGGMTPDEASSGIHMRLGDEISGRVAETLQTIVASDVQQSLDPMNARAQRMGIDAYVCLPLIHTGKLLGTLGFGRRGTASFEEDEVRFLTTFAVYVALAKHRIVTDHALRAGIAERERLLAERLAMERKVVELTRMGALGAVAATIAHELNQPLSAAANYMSAIRLDHTPSQETTRERAGAAEAQLQRAGEIIRRIRRMVSHNDLTLEANALEPIVAEAISLVAAARPDRFRIELDDAARHATLDRVQIVQVLANLLRNAVEATIGAENPLVIIQTKRRSANEVEIRVIDNGAGIPAEMQAELFQPQLGTSRRGIGLGLAISRNLVEMHGGGIRVEDTPGGGATFCFTLPAVPV
jgi:C4-dicarboxylate-specific signal transduction histidine kinase